MQLRDEKGAMQVSLQLSQREATEARGLWETEIRSRASISLRVSPPPLSLFLRISPFSGPLRWRTI